MNLKSKIKGKLFDTVAEVAQNEGITAQLIGGYVRDLLLERPSKDIDFVVESKGIEFAQKVAKKLGVKRVEYFKNFGTAMFKYNDFDVEFVGARKESYQRNSRNPIVEDGSLEEDQLRRDFTINAMAIGLNKENFGRLVDPFNGLDDLENQLIRTPQNPEQTFSDDPLRIMRGIRFAATLQFRIHPETFQAIVANKDRLDIVSMERIADELNKILLSPSPSYGFSLLDNVGILEKILPELTALKGVEEQNNKSHKENFRHTLIVVDNIAMHTNNLWLRWAALLHDIGKAPTKRPHPKNGFSFHGHELVGSKMVKGLFERLKLPLNEKMKYVQKLVLLSSRPAALTEENVTDAGLRRLLFDAGDDIDDLMTLCEADITTKNQQKRQRFLDNFKKVRQKLTELEEKDKIRNWQPPLSGDEIIHTFNIQPSKEVGILKNKIREAILDGIIPNNKQAAMEFMIDEGKKLGLQPKNSNNV